MLILWASHDLKLSMEIKSIHKKRYNSSLYDWISCVGDSRLGSQNEGQLHMQLSGRRKSRRMINWRG